MSSLSTVEERLPPGFRFHPKDEELICDYLMKQVMGCALHTPLLIEVDLNKCEPWDIPENARVGDKEWYFYSIRDRKYASGIRTNRATKSGYWKATGKDRPVFRKKTLVGMRKTLVFYEGRAPKGTKTDWVMHEFRLQHGPKTPHQSVKVQGDWVLCRVLYKTSKSELIPKQQLETSNVSPSSSEYLNIIKLLDDDDEQVPCFSNFATNPTFSSLVTNAVVDSGSAGPYRNSETTATTSTSTSTSCCCSMDEDKNDVMRGVWGSHHHHHLTKMENGGGGYYNNLGGGHGMIKTCPPSYFGEGSTNTSHTFLSPLQFSSIWNHFSS